MIIYGISSRLLKEAPVENLSCTNCDHQSSVVSIYQRYFDLFWIPTFPIGKKIVLVCPNCEHVVEEKKFPEHFKQPAKQLKSSLSTPKYMFTGLVLILAFLAYIAFGAYEDNQLEKDYVSNPQTGDVYTLYDENEESEYKYYFYKIAGIEEDSVFFNVNDYYYNGITTILEPEDGFYYQFEISFHKVDVKKMYDMDEIKAIYRDYTESSGFDRTISSDSLFNEYKLDSLENALSTD